ncbi:fasciclin domain-containing protein [Deinococcus sp.]|uniref:fasciclin domain-containing protein n=1 Tax=Deinococcus sp. TaxID=47478 RepID=UPI003C7E9CBF
MKKSTVLLSLGLTLGSLSLGTVALAGGSGGPADKPTVVTPACKTITDLVGSDPQFSTLLTAVQAAGLEDTLKGGSYTVFAPTNAAFAKVPSDTLAGLLNDAAMLKAVLLYHVVPGKVSAKQVMNLKSAKTANGANVSITVSGGKVMINTATVIKADVLACNGIVHVIDTVLMPPTAAAPAPAPVAAAAAAPAPSAPAPAAATPAPATPDFNVTNIPVIPQPRTTPVPAATTSNSPATDTTATTTADTTTATTTDTAATATTTDTTAAAATSRTLYDVISSDDRFSTLAVLLSDAGLDVTLMSGQYTVFAPTNDAFAKVDDNTLAVLASDPELLKKVLLYHVVAGKIPAAQVLTSTQLASAEGSSLAVMVSGSTVTVGKGTVTATDIAADNGVVHAIDSVLLPPDVTIPAAVALPAAPAPVATTAPAATSPAPVTTGPAATYTFKHNPNTADPSAAGTAVATTGGTSVTTVLTLTGLTAGKAYIAHYHAYGPDSSTDPCASNGPVTVGFPNFTADASGKATVTLTNDASKIAGDSGAYINVHFASDPSVVPICAPVKVSKS